MSRREIGCSCSRNDPRFGHRAALYQKRPRNPTKPLTDNDLAVNFGCVTIVRDASPCRVGGPVHRVRVAAARGRRPARARATPLQPGSVRSGRQCGRAGAADAGARRCRGSRRRARIPRALSRQRRPAIWSTRASGCAVSIRSAFPPRERAEYIVGLGEALYFDGAFGAAAMCSNRSCAVADALLGDARERVLDWWASVAGSRRQAAAGDRAAGRLPAHSRADGG